MRSLIDIAELSVGEIDALLNTAYDIIENPAKYSEKCKGKKLAFFTVFCGIFNNIVRGI